MKFVALVKLGCMLGTPRIPRYVEVIMFTKLLDECRPSKLALHRAEEDRLPPLPRNNAMGADNQQERLRKQHPQRLYAEHP